MVSEPCKHNSVVTWGGRLREPNRWGHGAAASQCPSLEKWEGGARTIKIYQARLCVELEPTVFLPEVL